MLSVVLAVLNEEQFLGRCLESVREIAGEIVIVDGGSTDGTLDIAKKFSARIIQTKNKQMFHINKQKALEAAKGEWILQLDADEVVSRGLAGQIKHVLLGKPLHYLDPKKLLLFHRHQELLEQRDGKIGSDDAEITAYFVPRVNHFLGGTLLHGGAYPDGVIRLVKKGKAKFPAKSVHEQMSIQGRVAWLSEPLEHFADDSFHRYLTRMNRYTILTAQQYKSSRLAIDLDTGFEYLVMKPIRTFVLLYFRHKGVLDGFPGFVWALFSGLHHAVAYLKYVELRHG